MIKYGFKIKNNEVYDTRINLFVKKAVYTNSGVIYVLNPIGYKRLYMYEALLTRYGVDEVFEILKMNSFLKNERVKFESILLKHHYITNMMMVYNYPVKYLTPRMFQLYKTCQKIKQNIE